MKDTQEIAEYEVAARFEANGIDKAESDEAVEFHDELLAELSATDPGDTGDTENDRYLLRYVRRVVAINTEIARLKDNFKAMIGRLERRVTAYENWFGPHAREIVEAKLAGGKKKSLTLPWGTVGLRKKAAAIDISDPDALLAATRTDESLAAAGILKVPAPTISKSALNDYFKSTGEVPPGCIAISESETFYVKE